MESGNFSGRATVRSIAKVAGVHYSTVSRILNNPPSAKDSELALRVWRIAEEANYSPDFGAASLRTGRTKMVGVIVPRLTDVVMAGIFESIQSRASQCGYLALASFSNDNEIEQVARTYALLDRRVDGLLIGDSHLSSDLLAELEARDVNFVLFARRSASYPHVGWDDELGGYIVGKHFVELGHTNIGVVAGPAFASTSIDRVNGFVRALKESGIDLPSSHIVESSFYAEGGRIGAEKLLQSIRPSAIFAVNDYSAIGVMGALRDAGLLVGRDVAVAGYNDIDVSRDLTIPLTSVKVPKEELGEIAMDMLLQKIQRIPTISRRLAPSLVVRASSGA